MCPEINWMFFAGAAVAITLAPGPDNLLVLSLGLTRGWREALALAWGLACGNFGHTLAVALGLAGLLAASPAAFALLKLGGAAYLGWLAWKSWRAPPLAVGGGAALPARSRGAWFRRGIVMNLLNPKVALFFLAFLPPFVPADAPHPGLCVVGLGTFFVAQVVVVFSSIALAAGAVGRWLQHRPAVQRWTPRVTAALFATLALVLLFDNLA